jgi:hypothetical protein
VALGGTLVRPPTAEVQVRFLVPRIQANVFLHCFGNCALQFGLLCCCLQGHFRNACWWGPGSRSCLLLLVLLGVSTLHYAQPATMEHTQPISRLLPCLEPRTSFLLLHATHFCLHFLQSQLVPVASLHFSLFYVLSRVTRMNVHPQ